MSESFIDAPKIKYPKTVFFIIINEFCERFAFYGLTALLSLYLQSELKFSESSSKMIFHLFSFLAYFFPIIGASIADSYLGKYKTILFLSLVYCGGLLIICLSSIKPLELAPGAFCVIGLIIVAAGTGGIKPCIGPFGADQFILPQQEEMLKTYFSMFYFSINVGSFLSTLMTPFLKNKVSCFNKEHCYPIAFGFPTIFMAISLVIFVIGKPFYKLYPPDHSVVLHWIMCVSHGIKMKIKSTEKVDHWLDYSNDKYGTHFVEHVKSTFKIMMIFAPIPIFFALFFQQGSAWTFQAARMNGYIGQNFVFYPDQVIAINAGLILILIPIFTYGIYPLLAVCNLLTKPLQRMTCGGIFAAISFLIAAIIYIFIENEAPLLPSEGYCQLRIYNPLNCTANIQVQRFINNVKITPMTYEKIDIKHVKGKNFLEYNITGCDNEFPNTTGNNFEITEKQTLGYYFSANGLIKFTDDITKSDDGNPKIRNLVSHPHNDLTLIYQKEKYANMNFKINSDNYSVVVLDPGVYKLSNYEDIHFWSGAVYVVLVNLEDQTIKNIATYEITKRNSIHLLWILPQFFILTVGEIMLSITGLEFSYTQAPDSMRAAITACWLLTSAFGNVIVIIIEALPLVKKESTNFFIYSALMLVDMGVFAFLATKYKYVKPHHEIPSQ